MENVIEKMERILEKVRKSTSLNEEERQYIKKEILLLSKNPKGYKLLNVLVEKYFLMDRIYHNYFDIRYELYQLIKYYYVEKNEFEKAQNLYIDYEKALFSLKEIRENLKKNIKDKLLKNTHTQIFFKNVMIAYRISLQYHNQIIKASKASNLINEKLAS